MSEDLYHGMFPALLIPMLPDYSVDIDELVDHINYLCKNGCKGGALFGTTSEQVSYSVSEKIRVLKGVVEKGVDPKKIILGTGHCSIEDTVEMLKAAIKYKVLAVLWHPPYYYKNLPDEGTIKFYKECLEKVNDKSLKVILYNFPALTHVPLTHNIIGQLLNLFPDNIIGIKDSSFDYYHTLSLIKTFPAPFKVYVGKDTDVAGLVKHGAVGTEGAICALSNIFPLLMQSLYEHGKDSTKPNRLDEINRLWAIVNGPKFIPIAKAIYAAEKGPKWNVARPPIVSLSSKDGQDIVRAIKDAKINK